MFGLFARRKREKFLLSMAKARAEGEGRAQIKRALATLGIKYREGESDTEYSARAADHMVRTIMLRAGVREGMSSSDDLYIGGLFIFAIANHLTYVLEAEFEQAASLGLLMFLTTEGMDTASAASSNETIVDAYNEMAEKKHKYLEAVARQFVKWTKAPDGEHMAKLAQLFNIGRQNIAES